MTTTTAQRIYTIQEVAEKTNVCDSYIRKLCRNNGIGSRHGSVWILTGDDLREIRGILRRAKIGRPKKKRPKKDKKNISRA